MLGWQAAAVLSLKVAEHRQSNLGSVADFPPSYGCSVVETGLSHSMQVPSILGICLAFTGRLANLDQTVVSCDIHRSWQEAPRLRTRMDLLVPGRQLLWEADLWWHFCTSGISPLGSKPPGSYRCSELHKQLAASDLSPFLILKREYPIVSNKLPAKLSLPPSTQFVAKMCGQ